MLLTIDAKGIYYQQLNELIREHVNQGVRHILLKNVRGQRYIGAGLTETDLILEIEGVPGEDLAFCLGGPTIIVNGPSQNAIANTMDNGTVIIHGLAGDALAYGMRGGKLYVRDNVGYRVGIHMKEYKKQKPCVVVGTTSGDFLGEYMAGGTLILLNRNNEKESVAGQADKTLATGIHGGEVFIFNYEIPAYLPGIGASLSTPDKGDLQRIRLIVEDFCRHFNLEAEPLLSRELVKILPAGNRPFRQFYYPDYPINTGLKPDQIEMASPCEAACPVGIPTGRFLRHLRLGENKEALDLIDEYTPFRYSNCGFICPHLCMEACSRGKVDFPVRISQLACEFRGSEVKKHESNQKTIAVIGAGPAGLAAAYFLSRFGYNVNVYEAAEYPGGKMYQVVSRRRLPLLDLKQDLERIARLGVSFYLNALVEQSKFREIYNSADHVIVATGAHRSVIPQVKGKELINSGLDFLKAFNKGEMQDVKAPIVIIGGGDVAIDGIEALVELGIKPKQITVIDIKNPSARTLDRHNWENAGVKFRYPLNLQEVTDEGVYVKDIAGRQHFIAGSAFAFINEVPEMDFLPDTVKKQLDQRGFFVSKEGICQTSDPKVSVIGDASGLGLVAHSIAKARECANQVDCLMQNKPFERQVRDAIKFEDLRLDRNIPIHSLEQLPVQEEHQRCLHCGICVLCDDCVNACPRQARTRKDDKFEIDLQLCGGCGTCAAACKGGVIRMVPR